jgi:hypothetical protein
MYEYIPVRFLPLEAKLIFSREFTNIYNTGNVIDYTRYKKMIMLYGTDRLLTEKNYGMK